MVSLLFFVFQGNIFSVYFKGFALKIFKERTVKTVKKIFLRTASLILLFVSFTRINISAEASAYSWSIKRNGTCQPIFSDEQCQIEQYGGYYMDKKHGDKSNEKVLYLTYDAGYENGNIEKILDVMKEKGVSSAFFILDHLIIKNPELIERMKNEGHLVCNHTKNHRNLSGASAEEIKRDLTALEDICREITGTELDKFFRFPEGKYSISALKHVNQLGYKTIFWSFAYEDWDNKKQMSSDAAMKKILSNTHNGAVILLHPTSSTNAEILGQLIDSWRALGYRFGTLYELCAE